jgi:hypothetical protein
MSGRAAGERKAATPNGNVLLESAGITELAGCSLLTQAQTAFLA